MYLDDIIDHAKVHFASKDSKTATLKIMSVEPVSLRIDHAVAGFSARAVCAVAFNKDGTNFLRTYLVLEHPNGEVDTIEIYGGTARRVRTEADAICERFLAKS